MAKAKKTFSFFRARCRCNISDSRCISKVQQCRPTLSHAFSPRKIESGILALTISFLYSLIITFFTVFVHLSRYAGIYDDEPCNETFNLYHGLINTTANIKPDKKEFLMKNKLPLDCMWVIHVEEGWKVSWFDMHSPTSIKHLSFNPADSNKFRWTIQIGQAQRLR